MNAFAWLGLPGCNVLLLRHLYLHRGKFSVVGHSLGSVILFDLLAHQK